MRQPRHEMVHLFYVVDPIFVFKVIELFRNLIARRLDLVKEKPEKCPRVVRLVGIAKHNCWNLGIRA